MKQKYVATFEPNSGTAHAIRGEWSYDRIDDARTLYGRKGPFGIEHLMHGELYVTCRSCQKQAG